METRLAARSPQRSSYESPQSAPPDFAWAPAPSQALIDRLAEAEIADQLAETRNRETKTASDARRADAEIGLIEIQRQKVAGEVSQQPLEERELVLDIKERELGIDEREARLLLIWTGILAAPLLAAIGAIAGSIDSSHLVGHGYELIGDKFWLLMKLPGSAY